MQSRQFSVKANRQDATGLERNLLGWRSEKRFQYFLGSVAVIIILSCLSATSYPPMMETARHRQILDSTLTISIAAQELVREPVEAEEALPIPNDEYRSIATASQYVIAEGLGTLVADGNGTYIVTHDHWSLLEKESGLVQIGNASGEQLLEIELATLKNLIRYRDGGTLVFDSPAELASNDNLTPAMIGETGSRELEYGYPFLLAHRQRDGRGGVSIMKVSLERTDSKMGQWTIRLQTPDGQSIIGGDSGGGVWLKGKLVGNIWTTIVMENKISSERRSTNSAIAAIYPLQFSVESQTGHLDNADPIDLNENVAAVVSQQVQALIPTSEQLIDGVIAELSKGWAGMSPAEREAFLALYDPADTGDVDETYVQAVLANYQRIQDELSRDVAVVYESNSSKCEDMRLYYTDLLKLHVCPYYLIERDEIRKARTLIHEMAHMALLATDRPYYRPTNKAYAQLTPRGSWIGQLPVVGPVIREIQRGDTLYHPDAYAHFAVAVSGQPVATGMYVSHHQAAETSGEIVNQPLAADLQVVDSWTLGS